MPLGQLKGTLTPAQLEAHLKYMGARDAAIDGAPPGPLGPAAEGAASEPSTSEDRNRSVTPSTAAGEARLPAALHQDIKRLRDVAAHHRVRRASSSLAPARLGAACLPDSAAACVEATERDVACPAEPESASEYSQAYAFGLPPREHAHL